MDIWERISFMERLCNALDSMREVASVRFKGNNYNGSILLTVYSHFATTPYRVELRDPKLENGVRGILSTTDPKELIKAVLEHLPIDEKLIDANDEMGALEILDELEKLAHNK